MFGFGSIGMILFWCALLYGVFFLFRHEKSTQHHVTHAPGKNALEILKERYTRGEITKEEFISMKKDIE
jgi:putative membrane protein